MGNLNVDDVDMGSESVHFTGKGSRERRVRFGPRTARALSRYLRVRAQHKGAEDMPRHYGASAAAQRASRPSNASASANG